MYDVEVEIFEIIWMLFYANFYGRKNKYKICIKIT